MVPDHFEPDVFGARVDKLKAQAEMYRTVTAFFLELTAVLKEGHVGLEAHFAREAAKDAAARQALVDRRQAQGRS
jgi:hypothetical protein